MASQADQLRKIGVEGFALIDKYYGPQRRDNKEPAPIVVVNSTTKPKFHHQPRWGGNRFHK
ncbi:hypothetical protein QN277_026804 [Acacia crassicarpa]|uniref:Uncharacterized protein n=1 Tax=Acacia crassicarpa TaxID=499986 RepID=A0AAE1JC38_9FABA|nr:hypothetical protein QN277_026804 [Acacia crassicarpa]